MTFSNNGQSLLSAGSGDEENIIVLHDTAT